ncbi:MAG: D-2-hydroxyacid dehydrogenase [Lachnospiraceae bacterium]|nr:D-2-hydroxyacid dehydrogenase [Lachnospiraceae bacterium]
MMETKKILVVLPMKEEQEEFLRKQVEDCEAAYTFTFTDSARVTEEEIREANIILGSLEPPARLKGAENVEWVQVHYAGADAYAAPGILQKETLLTNAVGGYGLTVSEHMLMQTFEMIRRMREYHINQSNRLWKHQGEIASVEGSTILVLGMGDIGGAYARKVKALGAYVIGIRKTNREKPEYVDEQYTLEELDKVIGRADIIAMVLPETPDTIHLMNRERLFLVKPGAFLLNAGRGSAVDLKALQEALDAGRICRAAIDVTEPEPLPEDHPLWDDPNVIITPHCAGGIDLPETVVRIAGVMGKNLYAYTHGGELINVVKH